MMYAPLEIEIVDFDTKHANDFKLLNLEWLMSTIDGSP